ncbi:hypothetical protein PR202_ga21574 [Eleusine coracana subsp. coracana]|uniref:At1g61320/AtMIF1 LRR domain-containing protein n=1 Tax=Eleusine coracana subsp. coracana TaxID=191504 RepID=A0AAV5CZH5_ELECO|nr:hypothetical protein PR202_ga21574 [Eleusine coracana subsp. coracana]
MPLRDAGLTASVSHAFLCSWRRRPSLIFSNQTLGLNESARVDNILENYLGTGLKTLKLLQTPNYSGRYHRFIDRWLQKAVTLGVQELTLTLAEHFTRKKYKFPCSIFAHGNGDSIRYLYLQHCAFHPTVGGLGCSTSLVRLHLFAVYNKGDELGHLLSKSLALESLDLMYCREIVCVKIPCLQRLTHLLVHSCRKLQAVESKAPNLSSFHFASDNHVQLSLGKALHVKTLYIDCSRPICHSRAKLASSTPNLEPLGIHSGSKVRSKLG